MGAQPIRMIWYIIIIGHDDDADVMCGWWLPRVLLLLLLIIIFIGLYYYYYFYWYNNINIISLPSSFLLSRSSYCYYCILGLYCSNTSSLLSAAYINNNINIIIIIIKFISLIAFATTTLSLVVPFSLFSLD